MGGTKIDPRSIRNGGRSEFVNSLANNSSILVTISTYLKGKSCYELLLFDI
jgi:hypothetical protein